MISMILYEVGISFKIIYDLFLVIAYYIINYFILINYLNFIIMYNVKSTKKIG